MKTWLEGDQQIQSQKRQSQSTPYGHMKFPTRVERLCKDFYSIFKSLLLEQDSN